MATKKTYYKNIIHIPGLITITLPDGSKRKFKSSTEAQAFFDKNYGDKYNMEIVSTQDNKGEITINGGELPEVVVTGKAPAKKPESDDSRPAFNPSEQRGVDKWIGANYSARFNRAYNRMGINPLNWPKYIPESYWDSETHRNVVEGGNIAAKIVAAPFVLKAMGAAYAVPEIAGALNLWGAYEGLSRLTSDEGVQKTYNKFKEGDWWGGAKSLGGDVLDVAMSLPFLNEMRQITQTTGKGLFSMGMANEFSRLHPTYNFKYNWRTGKFDLTPKPGAAAEATTMAKTDMLPGQVRELPGAPRALGSANPETYGSMNKVADALEAGELPTNQQISLASQLTTRPYFAQRNIPDPSNLNDEELASYINMLESTEAPYEEYMMPYLEEAAARLALMSSSRPVGPIQEPPMPNDVVAREYYLQLANERNAPVRTPDGYDVLPIAPPRQRVHFSDADFERPRPLVDSLGRPLPPAPPELNNVAEAGPVRNNNIEEFDWDAYDMANGGTEATTQAASTSVGRYDDLLRNSSYLRNPDGSWTHSLDDGTISFRENGEITFSPGWRMPEILLQPNEVEEFILSRNNGTLNLNGQFRGLDDLMVRNQYPLNSLGDVNHFGGDFWTFSYNHPNGTRLPIRLTQESDGSVGMRLGNNGTPNFIPVTPETTSQEVYDGIINYANNIRISELTEDQRALILSVFPNEIPAGILGLGRQPGSLGFTNDNGGRFVYNPLDQTFSMRLTGYRRFTNAPMSSLTPEALEPIKAPTIITSSERLPIFSRLSQGTDWGRVLGVDPGFNALIDFGLLRQRPTIELVRNALGISGDRNRIAHGGVHFRIEEYNPNYTENMPLIETPHDVPILHLNMVPQGGGELTLADKLWLGKQMSSLSAGAKGVDIASTSNINPTVSRFVSDLSAATNLSDMDKYNILKMFLDHPEYFYRAGRNTGDYSPFSWLNNAIMGNRPKRFFTEPSINTYTGRFNSYGSLLESPIKGLFNMNPSLLGTESPGISLNLDRATLILNWMKEHVPNLYAIPQDRTQVPFPVTTFRKKGGKLVKKKFNLNGKKKTCK